MVVVRPSPFERASRDAVQPIADTVTDLPPFIDRDLLEPPVTTRDLPRLQTIPTAPRPSAPAYRTDDPNRIFHQRERERLYREDWYLEQQRRRLR